MTNTNPSLRMALNYYCISFVVNLFQLVWTSFEILVQFICTWYIYSQLFFSSSIEVYMWKIELCMVQQLPSMYDFLLLYILRVSILFTYSSFIGQNNFIHFVNSWIFKYKFLLIQSHFQCMTEWCEWIHSWQRY